MDCGWWSMREDLLQNDKKIKEKNGHKRKYLPRKIKGERLER